MKIGIIGIGILGNAVALHLLDSGYNVTVYNRTKEKTIEVEKKGAHVASSPKMMAKKKKTGHRKIVTLLMLLTVNLNMANVWRFRQNQLFSK